VNTGEVVDILYNTRLDDTSDKFEEMLENEFEGARFYRGIHSMTNSELNRECYYGIITDKQQNALRLLRKGIENAANLRETRIMSEQRPDVTTKEIDFSSEYIKESLRIPVLSGIKDPNIQSQINNSIASDIMEFKRQMEEAAQEAGEEARKAGESFIPYIISNVYSVTFNRNNIISITILYYQNIAGKNYYIKTSYNYDLETGRSLSIGDLFWPDVDYRTLLNNEIRRRIAQNEEQYFPGTLENFTGIAEDQPFYLEGNELVIFFGFNQIAPRESQIPVIRIPLAKLSNELKPKFL
jgi:hypothetical protein